MRKKGLLKSFGCLSVVLMLSTMLIIGGWTNTNQALAASDEAPEKIRIGCAIALSGISAIGAELSQLNPYNLWIEQTNAKGGIYVPKYKKKIPVELIVYDDRSDIETSVKMAEKLMVQDKVDFMLPPWGTAFNFAVAPVANRYKYFMMGITVSSPKLAERLKATPYFFVVLGQPARLVPSTVALMQEFGVQSVAVIHLSDLFGLEHVGIFKEEIGKTKIKLSILQSYPLDIQDMSPLIKRVQAENVDALINYGYPPHTFMLNKQLMGLRYNPKFFQNGVGVQYADYRDAFGAAGVDGVFGQWCLTEKMPYPGAKEYFTAYQKKYGKEPARGGAPAAYASMQIIEQGIQKVGDLNREKIRDVIATETFDTIIGPMSFKDNINQQWPGNIGQWQKGVYEVMMPKEFRTAKPMYPKPDWPKAQ
jgi:branched-chain amino acid transport system substrate-binding protein